MKYKILIISIFVSISAKAQTIISVNYFGNASSPYLALSAASTISDPKTLPLSSASSTDITAPTLFGAYPYLTANSKTEQNPVADQMTSLLDRLDDKTKPNFSDYTVLPNGAADKFEFHHEATTINGSTITLSETSLTAIYNSSLAASSNNGAKVIEHAVFEQAIYGSGNTPWLIAAASGSAGGPAIQLNSFANRSPLNNNASFSIETANGNKFQMATDDHGAILGWTNPTQSFLRLTAERIDVDGSIAVDGLLNARAGILLGKDSSTLNIDANNIHFANNTGKGFIGFGADNSGSVFKNALIVESTQTGGIVLNAMPGSMTFGSISFAVNSTTIGRFTTNGLMLGQGFGEPTAIFALYSNNQGFLPSRLTDDQIYGIKNPPEGLEVYSLAHHTKAFFDGERWMLLDAKKMRPFQ